MKGLARTKNKRHKQLLATLLLLTFFFIHPPAARASPETILINEVMYDPDGADSGYEWLELINLSDSTVNLEGWTIQVAGNSFADKTELPEYWIEPGSIVLVGEPNVPDTDIIVPSLSMQNGGSATDGVRILNPESAVIDTLLYDSPNTNALPNDTGNPGEHFATDVPSGSSLARISGSDSNNCEEDFIQTDEPTPGEPNTVSPNAVFEISETIFKGTEVTLEGKESFDPDGEIKSWHWIIDHENIEIIEKEGELIEITFDQVGEASITLTVTDNDGLSSALTIETEVVNDPDNPDIIKISEVKTLDAKTIVTIIGTVTAPVPCLYEKETYIQDESGGIRVRITQDQKLEYDKTYQITGKLGTTYGENRIEAQQIRSIEQNTTISPYTININNISENNIGLLITTEAEVIKKRGNYIYLSMENNDTTLRLYFSKYSGLEAPDDTKGQTLKVTGVVSRYGTNSDGTAKIRIMPRFENDIAKTENHELLAVTGKDILSSITAAIVFPAAFTLLAVITARTQHQKTFSC